MSDTFQHCDGCRAIIDTHHTPLVGGKCPACIPRAVHEFPLPDHFRATLEPYIQWRIDQAVALEYLRVFDHQRAIDARAAGAP